MQYKQEAKYNGTHALNTDLPFMKSLDPESIIMRAFCLTAALWQGQMARNVTTMHRKKMAI